MGKLKSGRIFRARRRQTHDITWNLQDFELVPASEERDRQHRHGPVALRGNGESARRSRRPRTTTRAVTATQFAQTRPQRRLRHPGDTQELGPFLASGGCNGPLQLPIRPAVSGRTWGEITVAVNKESAMPGDHGVLLRPSQGCWLSHNTNRDIIGPTRVIPEP